MKRGAAAEPVLCGHLNIRNGHKCTRPAGLGTDHVGEGYCHQHEGKERARSIGLRLAEARAIDPHEALLQLVYMAAGEVAYFNEMVAEYVDKPEDTWEQVYNRDGDLVALKASFFVEQRRIAMNQLATYSRYAIDAGVAERRVRLAEQQGELIAAFIKGVLGDLGLTPEQRSLAPEVVRRRLIELDAHRIQVLGAAA